tara:strand:- start:57255 stop:58598 length:1344 start_codon:yes stop_codon:yes gene_type:complete
MACAAPRGTWGAKDADVLIIGAGLAGLHVAQILEDAGKKVLVVEGNNRTGGRVHTLYDLPGSPDAGGIQIGTNYRRFMSIAERLGVELYLPDARSPGALYNIGGQSMTAAQWPTSPQNKLAEAEKKITPDALFFNKMRGLPPLVQPIDWMKAESHKLDISVREFLQSQNTSDEAMRIINANINGTSIDSLSVLHVAKTLAIYRQGASAQIKYVRGGTQRVTDAMAAALSSEILLNSPVAGIADEGDLVRIRLADGRRFVAGQVICTAPFAAIRDMPIEAPIPPAMREIIAQLPYTKASFAYLQAKDPFWKEDGLPGDIWSDDPFLGRVFVLGDDPAMLKVWINGADAEALDKMPEGAVGAAIIARIEAARPSAKGKLSLVKLWSWQKQRFARGVYSHMGVGQRAALAEAAQYAGKRVNFAGDHLAQAGSGLEGALESGELAAKKILR